MSMKNLCHLLRVPDNSVTESHKQFNTIKKTTVYPGLKKLLAFILLGCLCTNKLSAHYRSAEPSWVYDTTVNGVEFYHSIAECNGKKVVFLKFNNKNNNKVEVSWKEVFTTQARLKQDGVHGQKKLTLLKGETSASDCAESVNRSCLILPADVSPAYAVEIRQFEFKDVAVSTIP